jgi:hypothetical protein
VGLTATKSVNCLIGVLETESGGVLSALDKSSFLTVIFNRETKSVGILEKYPAITTGFFFFMWYVFAASPFGLHVEVKDSYSCSNFFS